MRLFGLVVVPELELDSMVQEAAQAGYDIGRDDGFASGYEAAMADREQSADTDDHEETLA